MSFPLILCRVISSIKGSRAYERIMEEEDGDDDGDGMACDVVWTFFDGV